MLLKRILSSLVLASSLLGATGTMAQPDPTLNQVYAAAQAGQLDKAQEMMQQVLLTHPNSAKAHYVRAELFARQGKLELARESLASADRLAPGLPFAKPEAVQALRQQIAPVARPFSHPASAMTSAPAGMSAAAVMGGTGNPANWLWPLLLTAGVLVIGYLVFRRVGAPSAVRPVSASQQPVYPVSYSGYPAAGTAGYGSGMPPTGNGPTPTSGLGGQILGGVATGLAVGAGVVAAEAIGRKLFGEHDAPVGPAGGATGYTASSDYIPMSGAGNINSDMGGQDFGMVGRSDTGDWDDTATASASTDDDWNS